MVFIRLQFLERAKTHIRESVSADHNFRARPALPSHSNGRKQSWSESCRAALFQTQDFFNQGLVCLTDGLLHAPARRRALERFIADEFRVG